MDRNRHIILALSALLAASLSAAPAMAKGHNAPQYAAPAQNIDMKALPLTAPHIQFAQNGISAAKAKSIARAQVKGGEVVDISRKGATYRVRVITKNGRVVDVLVDANTGRVKR